MLHSTFLGLHLGHIELENFFFLIFKPLVSLHILQAPLGLEMHENMGILKSPFVHSAYSYILGSLSPGFTVIHPEYSKSDQTTLKFKILKGSFPVS